MIMSEMKNYNTILTEKQQKYQLLIGYQQIDRNKSLTGEEILPSDQRRVTEQAKFTNFFLEKAFKQKRKTIENQGAKQVEYLKILKTKEDLKAEKYEELESTEGPFLKNMRSNEIKNEIDEIRKWKKKINKFSSQS